ncbi:hypothetical protein GCM10008024_05510 [Allgaiera indica]|uniref:Uncharacterized protein n=1 Tax=Allgaiera indica TaxID=765699 RepID=A0AAN4ZXY2_9RHOB|nr:hypothetical protein GCM10008024_05510 [Allgaiera indica]
MTLPVFEAAPRVSLLGDIGSWATETGASLGKLTAPSKAVLGVGRKLGFYADDLVRRQAKSIDAGRLLSTQLGQELRAFGLWQDRPAPRTTSWWKSGKGVTKESFKGPVPGAQRTKRSKGTQAEGL